MVTSAGRSVDTQPYRPGVPPIEGLEGLALCTGDGSAFFVPLDPGSQAGQWWEVAQALGDLLARPELMKVNRQGLASPLSPGLGQCQGQWWEVAQALGNLLARPELTKLNERGATCLSAFV